MWDPGPERNDEGGLPDYRYYGLEAEVIIEARLNPGFRPGCLGAIEPGDLYAGHLSESAACQKGRAYCRACRTVWCAEPAR